MNLNNMLLLSELSERVKERDARHARMMEKSCEEWREQLRRSPGMQRMCDHTARCRRQHMGPEAAAKLCAVPLAWLLDVTRGRPFRFDFGKDHEGGEVILFHVVDLVAFAKAGTRLYPLPCPRPRRRAAAAVHAA
jgi:hypothetical protein